MIVNCAWDVLPVVRAKFPTRDLTLVPVAMKEWAYVVQDRDTCENVAELLYDYNNGHGYRDALFGYKYKLKILMKTETAVS